MDEIVHEDVKNDSCDDLNDVPITQAGRTRPFKLRVIDLAPLDDNASRHFQDRICFGIDGFGVDDICDLVVV